jgi:hypothetical protein
MPVTYPVEKIIDEEGNVLALVDVSARALLGDDELQTDAKTCTGAINELKGTLDYCYKSYDTITSIASDTTIISFATGTYKIALSSASTYLPSRYGVLNVYKSNTYSSFCFISTDGKQYERIANNSNNTWYNSWSELALQNTLEFKAGDTYSLYFGNGYTVIPARLGWNRARCIMSFSLPKNIPNDLNVGITAFPSEGTIYKESSSYSYTNASVYAVSRRGNIVTITFTFAPTSSLSGSDCSAIVELFNGTLTFSFTS